MLSLETGGACTPLLPGTADAARWRFTVRAAQFSTRHGSVTAVQTFTVPERVNGEVRALTLSSPDGIDGTVRLTFEAVLAPWEDYVNHPAFARLGFQSVLRRNALLLRRLGRGEKPETWLCAVCDRQADFYAEGAIPGWLRAGYVQVRVAVHTPPDTPWRVRFALGVGAHEDDAFAAAQRALVLPPESAAALPGALAAQYGMTDAELEGAMAHVSPLLFPTAAPMQQRSSSSARHSGRTASPAICLSGARARRRTCCGSGHAARARHRVRSRAVHLRRRRLPPANAHKGARSARGARSHALSGCARRRTPRAGGRLRRRGGGRGHPSRHGAHALHAPLLPPPGDRRTMPHRQRRALGRRRHGILHRDCRRARGATCSRTGASAFLRPTRARGIYGTATRTPGASTAGCATVGARGTETLRMTTRTGAVSLFDDDGHARVEYGFGWAAWERTVDGMSVRVTAFVPEDANARVLLIECAGRARITWHTDLVCAAHDADAPAVVTAYSGRRGSRPGTHAQTRPCASARRQVCRSRGGRATGFRSCAGRWTGARARG